MTTKKPGSSSDLNLAGASGSSYIFNAPAFLRQDIRSQKVDHRHEGH